MLTETIPTLKRADDLGMAEAFGRDPILAETVHGLIEKHGIWRAVETGTWRGYTTRALSQMVEYVAAIEIDPLMCEEAQRTTCDRINITFFRGDSAKLLPSLAGAGVLFYLDAHWFNEWPLFDELDAIAEDGRPCVIVVHDCQVPDHPEFGFDSYGGVPLTFDLLKPYLDKLKFPWRHSFNSEAQGHRRGVLFIEPCDA